MRPRNRSPWEIQLNQRRWIVATLGILALAAVTAGAQTGDSLIQLKAAAEAGDPAAQTSMAQRDSAHAETWYRRAAAQDYAPAEGRLGNLLIMRAEMGYGIKSEEKPAVAREALKWMGLASSQGDQQGQSDLAQVCYQGKWVKPDLIAAYQWSELACQTKSFAPAAIMGQTIRDAAILKMTAPQLAEGQRRVADFKPRPAGKPAIPAPTTATSGTPVKLTTITGEPDHRQATIGGVTFEPGATGTVQIGGKPVAIECLTITATNATISIPGRSSPQILPLKPELQ